MMDYQIARNLMVTQQIRPWQVLEEKVLHIMGNTPRERFVPEAYQNLAYSDTEIPLTDGQTMLAPKIIGRALQALKIQTNDRVLEIGTGTGYVTALLAELSDLVTSVEIRESLHQSAKENLASDYPHLNLIQGDAGKGWSSNAPYDVILATGSYPDSIPETLLSELNPQGRLFAVIGRAPIMKAMLFIKANDNSIQSETLFETCVQPLDNVSQNKKFVL